MQPSVPQEETEISLPKTCYFNDGKSKVDFVIVYPKLEERFRHDRSLQQIDQFVANIKTKGLLVEKETGKFHTTLVFLKIHAPYKILTRYASIYNIMLTCQNPYYKYRESVWFNCLTTVLTRPKPSSWVYKRAEKTLSGERPSEITSGERSKIVYEILKRISFIFDGDEMTLQKMLHAEVFLQAYPIHDGDCSWTEDGPLTDRQLLFHFWANFKYLLHQQPTHLVAKYYGPKVSFYFALINLYTKMLVVPSIIGTLTIVAGYFQLRSEDHFIEDEVCRSKIILCSDQQLKSACGLMKIAYIIDNPVTIIYVILCSFWGAIFWNLWQRRQAMLRLRWNLSFVKADRTMRKEFQENARTRKSSITGEIEYYVPAGRKVLSAIFSHFVIILMALVFFILIVIVVEYRFMLRKRLNYDKTLNANEIEMFSASLLTATIIIVLDSVISYVLKMYAKIVRFLTMIRLPRTQSQYNRIYLHMMFTITFANHFSPLFYLAYFKGFFHRFPGDVSDISFVRTLQTDLCKPAGCLVDLGMQLVTIMVIKTVTRCSLDFAEYIMAPWHKYAIPKESEPLYGQWEKDFAMRDLDDSVINQLFAELMLQYGFITFFNASLPVIGLVALVHNILKIHHDSYRFLKLYRRPVLEQVPGIEGWNQILKVITVLGCISNTFIVAFRTQFIQRVLYKNVHGSYKGYINSTLSKFAVVDFQEREIMTDHGNDTYCFYRGFRYPPEHERKYEWTEAHWHHIAIRAIYFIILEKCTLLLSITLSYLIPEIPRKVKVKLEYEEKLLKAFREAQLEGDKTGV